MQPGGHTMQVKLLKNHKQRQTQRKQINSVTANIAVCVKTFQLACNKYTHTYTCMCAYKHLCCPYGYIHTYMCVYVLADWLGALMATTKTLSVVTAKTQTTTTWNKRTNDKCSPECSKTRNERKNWKCKRYLNLLSQRVCCHTHIIYERDACNKSNNAYCNKQQMLRWQVRLVVSVTLKQKNNNSSTYVI